MDTSIVDRYINLDIDQLSPDHGHLYCRPFLSHTIDVADALRHLPPDGTTNAADC